MAKKVVAPPPKPDVLGAIAQQTGTDKADWHFLPRSSPKYAKGFRYVNHKTKQLARRTND